MLLNRLLSDPLLLVSYLLIFMVSISLHEFGHAFVADRLGDPTPRRAGRVTLNPASHVDLFGTLMLLLVGFGWAKPVPTAPFHFRSPRLGRFAVAAAGPLMNLLLAALAIAVTKHLPVE